MQTHDRKVIDCRDYPSENRCTLTITGTESEVLKAASEHAVSSHGHEAGPELVHALKTMLRDEED